MSQFWKAVVIIAILIYILSPVDLLPGFSPISLLDDAFVTGILIYFLKTGRLPGFVYSLGRWIFGNKSGGGKAGQETGGAESAHQGDRQEEAGGKTRPKDPHAVLGVSPGASKQEIQAAYRKAAQQYHPDKVAHLGPELQELAREKFVEIQAAYEYLMNR